MQCISAHHASAIESHGNAVGYCGGSMRRAVRFCRAADVTSMVLKVGLRAAYSAAIIGPKYYNLSKQRTLAFYTIWNRCVIAFWQMKSLVAACFDHFCFRLHVENGTRARVAGLRPIFCELSLRS